MTRKPSIHANCVLLGEAGVLIRGRSGAGKSTLSEALIAEAAARGWPGLLVADDRTLLETGAQGLTASVPPTIAGLIERRGVGIVEVPYVATAIVRLVVDLEAESARMPSNEADETVIDGIRLPRIAAPPGEANQAVRLVFGALEGFRRRACVQTALAFAPQHGKLIVSAPHAPACGTAVATMAAPDVPDPERNEFCAETA